MNRDERHEKLVVDNFASLQRKIERAASQAEQVMNVLTLKDVKSPFPQITNPPTDLLGNIDVFLKTLDDIKQHAASPRYPFEPFNLEAGTLRALIGHVDRGRDPTLYTDNMYAKYVQRNKEINGQMTAMQRLRDRLAEGAE